MSNRKRNTRQNAAKKEQPKKSQGYPDCVAPHRDSDTANDTKRSKAKDAEQPRGKLGIKKAYDSRPTGKGKVPAITTSEKVTKKAKHSAENTQDVPTDAGASYDKIEARAETKVATKKSEVPLKETPASKSKSFPSDEDEPAAGPDIKEDSSYTVFATNTVPIDVPESMARLWIQALEPKDGDKVDKRIIAIRHVNARQERFYLLEDLKWYRLGRVPKHRKEAWRKDTLKVAMTRESVNLKVPDPADVKTLTTTGSSKEVQPTKETQVDLRAAYDEWGCFAVMAGHPDVDPLHDDENAWKKSIYLNVYKKPIGEQAIRAHRSKSNGESVPSMPEVTEIKSQVGEEKEDNAADEVDSNTDESEDGAAQVESTEGGRDSAVSDAE
ncbi:hypothetical protein J1614_000023 [Plenodomus biglobosus]|nr:hypothetical protein J1614_000023 [Plenodomus biglobosus]